jgi:hypothetical protein
MIRRMGFASFPSWLNRLLVRCQRDDGLGKARLLIRVVRFQILLLTYFAGLVEMLRRKE